MSELRYWVEHSWGRKPVYLSIIRINNFHSSTINYTKIVTDPYNNYKTETYLNGRCLMKIWEDRKNCFNDKKANIVEIFRFKVNELDLNSYDTVK